jgi:hypothetical protein
MSPGLLIGRLHDPQLPGACPQLLSRTVVGLHLLLLLLLLLLLVVLVALLLLLVLLLPPATADPPAWCVAPAAPRAPPCCRHSPEQPTPGTRQQEGVTGSAATAAEAAGIWWLTHVWSTTMLLTANISFNLMLQPCVALWSCGMLPTWSL